MLIRLGPSLFINPEQISYARTYSDYICVYFSSAAVGGEEYQDFANELVLTGEERDAFEAYATMRPWERGHEG